MQVGGKINPLASKLVGVLLNEVSCFFCLSVLFVLFESAAV